MNSKEDLQKPFAEICVITDEEKTYQGAIKWHIPEIDLRQYLEKCSQGYYIDSNTFSIGTPSYCSFYFRVLSGYISIIFNKKLPDCAWIKGEIYLDGIVVHKTFSVSAKDFDKKIDVHNLCRSSDLHKLLYSSNGCSIHCLMKIKEREVKCTFDKEKTTLAESRNYYSNKETLKHETFTNVSITVNGHLFKTHKTLLAQIPYFQALFDANESERHFELTDVELEIFKYILTFLYSGDIPLLHFNLACKLYITASDLKIFDLKCLCSSYLGANLAETNVIIVLKLAHAYGDTALKKECFKFIKKSDIEILAQKSIIL